MVVALIGCGRERSGLSSRVDASTLGSLSTPTTHPEASFLSQQRAGQRPTTTPTNPHTQLDQLAPQALQEQVFAFAKGLAGVALGRSHVSVPGTRAFHLPGCSHSRPGAFLMGQEFAHLHPPSDGSLHMVLPFDIVERVITNGWAESHPLAGKHGLPGNIVMVYGPRDQSELSVVNDLIRTAHDFASEP